jgi:hypothetical protein
VLVGERRVGVLLVHPLGGVVDADPHLDAGAGLAQGPQIVPDPVDVRLVVVTVLRFELLPADGQVRHVDAVMMLHPRFVRVGAEGAEVVRRTVLPVTFLVARRGHGDDRPPGQDREGESGEQMAAPGGPHGSSSR